MTRRKLTIPVEAGQVRLDPDPRQKGTRTVTVERIDGRYAYGLSSAGIKTRILTDALAKWPLVQPTPTESP